MRQTLVSLLSMILLLLLSLVVAWILLLGLLLVVMTCRLLLRRKWLTTLLDESCWMVLVLTGWCSSESRVCYGVAMVSCGLYTLAMTLCVTWIGVNYLQCVVRVLSLLVEGCLVAVGDVRHRSKLATLCRPH